MTLLREIQTEVARADSDLAAILRKCKILAARLDSKEFAQWVSWELDGYPEEQPVPPYRKLSVQYFGNFMGAGWDAKKQPFLWPVLGKDAYAKLNPFEFRAGVAKVAALAEGAIVPRPELALLVQGKMFPDMQCVGAWVEIGGNEFQQLMSAVRNRILDFVLEIEKANPSAGEAEPNSHPVPAEKLQPLVQNVFNAPVGNIAQNSQDFTQAANLGVSPGDLAKFVVELRTHLGELRLSPEDERRVDVQLKTIDVQLDHEPNLTIIREAVKSVRNITEGAIGTLLMTTAQPHIWAWIHSILAQF